MVFWKPWRGWLVEDFSDLAAPADPEAFPVPLGAPVFPPFKVLGSGRQENQNDDGVKKKKKKRKRIATGHMS